MSSYPVLLTLELSTVASVILVHSNVQQQQPNKIIRGIPQKQPLYTKEKNRQAEL